ncbi:helix-turn-helix domain-containing protein [Paenibacillus elgii]|uniref:helix-turn-helix domain-containing protein n=1 Tax=Paenibacillus elgii TaxID=189691 RepID=UPI0013D8239E|nr:helix-turn-helix transcriptional regulator [Paenibacillus elgii]
MIHSKLKLILDKRGISIRQLAKDIDYRFDSVRALYNNQTERYPRELLDKLCSYLGVNVSDLLEYRNDDSKNPPVD